MALSSHGYTFDFDNTVSVGTLPPTFKTQGNVLGAAIIMIFWLMWGGAGSIITWGLFQEPFPASPIPLAPLVISVGLFLFGLYSVLLRVETVIDRSLVTIRRRTWFRTRNHAVSLVDYPGILRVRVTYTRNKQTHVAWRASLPYDEVEGRKLVESYAQWLQMPALEENDAGFDMRPPGDVDRPGPELAAAGKVASDYHEGKFAPAELKVERGADMIVLHFLKAPIPLKLVVIIVAVVAPTLVMLFLTASDIATGLIVPAVAAFIIAVVLFMSLGKLRARRQLILRRDRVIVAALSGKDGKPKVSAELRLDEIEGVRVARGTYAGLALWFDTDRGSFPTGDNTPRPALDYARDLVIAALATAKDSSQGDEAE